jgi:hypothetical protein
MTRSGYVRLRKARRLDENARNSKTRGEPFPIVEHDAEPLELQKRS